MKQVLVILLAGWLSLMPLAAQKTGKGSGSDGSIYDQVKMRLAGDSEVKGGNLEVDVKTGVVTIKGIVPSDRAKSKAEKLTKKVKGVSQVINQLTVAP